jgi:diadenosine tetraphosphate (Ap4A) HIT family hydrolase
MSPTRGEPCELCVPRELLLENGLAYARNDDKALSRGHLLVIPKRHVASFFDMTADEQAAVLALLREAQVSVQKRYSPDGYNIGVNVGRAAGQSRMHVHVHLIPRYSGDVPDPRGGIRRVLAESSGSIEPGAVSLEELIATVARMETSLSLNEQPLPRRLWDFYERLVPRFERDLKGSARDVALAKSAALMVVQAATHADT